MNRIMQNPKARPFVEHGQNVWNKTPLPLKIWFGIPWTPIFIFGFPAYMGYLYYIEFQTLDENKDGYLSNDEVLNITGMDTNKDGKVSLDEFRDYRLKEDVDSNKDGEISIEELKDYAKKLYTDTKPKSLD